MKKFLLSLAVVVASITMWTATVKAQTPAEVKKEYEKGNIVKLYQKEKFDVKKNAQGEFCFGFDVKIDRDGFTTLYFGYCSNATYSYTVSDSTGKVIFTSPEVTTEENGYWDSYKNSCEALTDMALKKGSYHVNMKFDDFVFGGHCEVFRHVTNVSVGCARKAYVPADVKVKSWTTSNKKIATVNNGKITGKKKGSCIVTATLADGTKCTYEVKVRNNQLIRKEPKLKAARKEPICFGTKIYYDKKGNLKINVSFINGTKKKVTGSKIHFVIYNDDSQKILDTTMKVKVVVKPNKIVRKTYTIKKSKLKKKSIQDLTECTGGAIWYYTSK